MPTLIELHFEEKIVSYDCVNLELKRFSNRVRFVVINLVFFYSEKILLPTLIFTKERFNVMFRKCTLLLSKPNWFPSHDFVNYIVKSMHCE